jgi:quercetin 2,3-dioxygenase
MIEIRASKDRGYAKNNWLESYHSFSFADYIDRAHVNFSVLRVINEDKVAAGTGFGMHPHKDMEIITYMLSGQLQHRDSMGNTSVIVAGDVQRMSAGTGVMHSEINTSSSYEVHLLQIWIYPAQNNLTPSYEEKHFSAQEKENQWRLIVSPNGHDGSITIHQDVNLYATILAPQKQAKLAVQPNRCAYLQVVRGKILLEGKQLKTGDAAKISEELDLSIQTLQETELLWFDLPVQPMQ